MAPNSRIFITRHAQAEHNVDLDYSSMWREILPAYSRNILTNIYAVLDARLTDQGRKQASSLVSRVPELQKAADLIVTSPLQRTLQTTLLGWAPAVKRLGLENVICLPEVQECNDFPW